MADLRNGGPLPFCDQCYPAFLANVAYAMKLCFTEVNMGAWLARVRENGAEFIHVSDVLWFTMASNCALQNGSISRPWVLYLPSDSMSPRWTIHIGLDRDREPAEQTSRDIARVTPYIDEATGDV